MAGLKQLIHEIHRRSLWQVLAIYVAASWAVIEAADVIVARFSLPEWVYGAAIMLLLVGLPIVLATAFVQEGVAPSRPEPPGVADDAAKTGTHADEAAGVRRLFTWRNAIGGGVLAFALWGVVAAAWLLFEGRPERETVQSAMTPAPGIAVLPFRVVGPDLELWREGMVDALYNNLDGAAGLRVINPRTVLSRWRRDVGEEKEADDPQRLLEVAHAVGATYALTGSMLGSGSEVRITVEVHDLDAAELRRAQVEGSPDSMLALVDRLSVEILRAGLVSEGAELPQLDLSAVTTTSLPALRAYLEGEQKFRRGLWEEAADDFDRAVEADSSFALAHYRLSLAYGWTELGPEKPLEQSRLAARHSDRLPERAALLLRGNAQLSEGDLAGIRTLEELTRRYLRRCGRLVRAGRGLHPSGRQGPLHRRRRRARFRPRGCPRPELQFGLHPPGRSFLRSPG